LSSVILGLKTLLKPFEWCYALIPILPSALIDILEAPQPLLLGISQSDYDKLELTEDEREYKSWILLDENKIQWGMFD